jgi:hypothetical protein
MTSKKHKSESRENKRRAFEETQPVASSQPTAFDLVPKVPETLREDPEPVRAEAKKRAAAKVEEPPVPDPEQAELALAVAGLGASIAALDDVLNAMNAAVDD